MTQVYDDIDLSSYIPALINILASRLASSASVTYRKSFGLNVLEWRIVVQLAQHSGISAQQVSAAVGQHKGPISRAIRQLEKKNLVRVDPAEKGNRHSLSITEDGMALYRKTLPVAMERESFLLSGFSEEERALLTRFLVRLTANEARVARL